MIRLLNSSTPRSTSSFPNCTPTFVYVFYPCLDLVFWHDKFIAVLLHIGSTKNVLHKHRIYYTRIFHINSMATICDDVAFDATSGSVSSIATTGNGVEFLDGGACTLRFVCFGHATLAYIT